MSEDKKVEMQNFLKNVSGDEINICAELYFSFLKDDVEHAAENLQYFYEEWEKYKLYGGTPSEPRYTQEEYRDIQQKVGPTAAVAISNLIRQRLPVNEFYKTLWENFMNNAFFATDLEKICAIYIGMLIPSIPYFQLPEQDGLAEEDFKEITRENFREIQKIRFAIMGYYQQRTQIAAYLLELFTRVEDPRVKRVLLAQAFSIFEKCGQEREKIAAQGVDTNTSQTG